MVSTEPVAPAWSPHPQRDRLFRAMVASVIIHLVLWGLWALGDKQGWWRDARVPVWLQKALLQPSQPTVLTQSRAVPVPKPQEPSMVFVEIDPSLAVAEPPKDARYYSSQSTKAANPTPLVETGAPKIEGKQDRIPKTFDTLKPVPPTPPPAPVVKPTPQVPPAVESPPQEARKPAGLAPGDTKTAASKPNAQADATASTAVPQVETPVRERPRTLVEARMRKGIIAGETMKQDGGTQRRGSVALDVKGTLLGAYDAAIVAAIQQRWYYLLEQRAAGVERRGRVVVEFNLHYNGRVTDLRVSESSVGDYLALLCQKAVEDPAPYEKWPSDMRLMNKSDIREVRFTFFYN